MNVELEEVCYVLLRTAKGHPIARLRYDLNWYPETRLTLVQAIQFQPTVKSVVTESPWIISCYPGKRVRVWDGIEWVRPDINTFGTSVEIIMDSILGINQSIPCFPLGMLEKDPSSRIKAVIKEADKGRE